MARLRLILLTGVALVLAGFAVTQFNRPNPSEPALGSVCRRRPDAERGPCYMRVLLGHLDKYGVADAVATLDTMAAADSLLAEHAHEFAHGIGMEAYDRADITATFAACGGGFSSGCRHGVIQAYFQAREQVSAANVEALCRPFKSATASRWVLFQCVHGMGHGLTMFHVHDLPRALADCDLLTDSWDRDGCYGGAFMENVVNATTPHHPAAQGPHHMTAAVFKAVNPGDPLYPCSVSAQRYWRACYQMQTAVMLHLNHGDIGDAARTCDRAPASMRGICHQSLGRDITAYAARDPQKTADLCKLSSEPYRPACYIGAAKALVDWTATTDAAFALCGIVGDQPGGPACYRALGEEIAMLAAGQEREAQCSRVKKPEALAACRQGAGLL